MAQRQAQSRGGRNRSGRDNEGMLPQLAKAVRAVENAVERGKITAEQRARYQVTAQLAREERNRVRSDESMGEGQRERELKRLDGVATVLAQTAAREPSLFSLLDEDAELSETGRRIRREMQIAAGQEPDPEPEPPTATTAPVGRPEKQVIPPTVKAAQLANPFVAPDFTGIRRIPTEQRRLVGWELIEPLLNAFEHPAPGAPACMELPDPRALTSVPDDHDLMGHQARLVAAVADGHRTFLLADEPGLGKTAQALLAAETADAFPMLVVVPNVVKTNWAREAEQWTPRRTADVIHGDGHDLDGFADIIVVNYEILDRHAHWLGEHGFRSMVIDEAHFIKNKKSQRSQHVLALADRVRQRVPRPLMMALTGTPLINDIDDFRAIWEFLGWIGEKAPRDELIVKLEEIGYTPADHAFYPAARQAVVDLGIVRRRKRDVAADLPARRIADMPVELEETVGRSLRDAERRLAERLLKRYDAALEARRNRGAEAPAGIDAELVRRVARAEATDESGASTDGESVFTMVRKIGQAKAELAADYAAQLARSAGKVVFFAKHIDVMNAAEELFARREIPYARIRGDQNSKVRQENIDAFTNDPEVRVIVCSLTAAGVGVNLQVSSDVVLAELPWTDAEQTQAIDRVHRIGQDAPVTAWRIIASQTMDAKIAELIDSKAGLAAKALDGAAEEDVPDSIDVQTEALVELLGQALEERGNLPEG